MQEGFKRRYSPRHIPKTMGDIRPYKNLYTNVLNGIIQDS